MAVSRETDVGDIGYEEGKIGIGAEHIARLDTEGQAIATDVPEIRQDSAEGLQPVLLFRVGIAPALERTDDRPALVVDRHINGLFEVAVPKRYPSRVTVDGLPCNTGPGQQRRWRPDHRLSGIASKSGAGMVPITAHPRDGDKAEDPEAGPLS